jgi:hypothetical protein
MIPIKELLIKPVMKIANSLLNDKLSNTKQDDLKAKING